LRNSPGLLIILVLLSGFFTALSFGNTLNVYFHCDDLLHIPYLYRVFHGEPGLLLLNFCGPWIGERSLYLFYRPITELSLALDYALYGINPFGYHLTNLLIHATNAALVGVLFLAIIRRIGLSSNNQAAMILPALVFATFPTHTEAIAWILARSDLVATTFYLTSLLLYVLAPKDKGKPFLLLSLLTFVLALGAKEMAISLPALIFCCELILDPEKRLSLKPDKQILTQAIKATLPYVVIATIYLLVRWLALGTLVGGYIGSIGESLNTTVIERWFLSGSLWQLMHPFNEELFGESHPLRLALRIIYGLCGVLMLYGAARHLETARDKYKLLTFALIFLVITLLPNWQVWGMSSSMSGGRIAYLPSVPLAILICSTLYLFNPGPSQAARIHRTLASIVLLALASAYSAISYQNNVAWLNATAVIKKIVADANRELDQLAAGEKLALFYLPSRVNGAFTFTTRGMLAGLFQPPLCATNRLSSIIALDFRPYWSPNINFNDFKQVATASDTKLVYFEADSEHLQNPQINFAGSYSAAAAGKDLAITSDRQSNATYYYLKPQSPINPTEVQFIELELTAKHKETPGKIDWYDLQQKLSGKKNRAPIFLSWNNGPGNIEDLTLPYWRDVPADGRPHKILIELASQKRWLLSHNLTELRLDLSNEFFDWDLSSARLLDGLDKLSELTVRDKNYGIATLAADSEPADKEAPIFEYRGPRQTPENCSTDSHYSTIIEVSKPYGAFEHYDHFMRAQKTSEKSHVSLTKILPGCAGSFTLDLDQGGAPEIADIYQVRSGLLDSSGTIVGTMSDAVTIRSLSPKDIAPRK
jgi:protein O-mannosyl-transferase